MSIFSGNYLDIYFDDLTPMAQRALLDLYNIKEPSEANWNIYPIMTFTNEDMEDEAND